MAKPNTKLVDTQNHGQAVKTFVHELQNARVPGEHPGIGGQVSEFARNKGGAGPGDVEDGVITVVKADGTKDTFATFAEALGFSEDGDTLYVGKGTYAEAVNLDENVKIIGEEGAVVDASGVAADPAVQGTFQLHDGFSGGSIQGLTVVAVKGGNAVVTIAGEAVDGISLSGNTFSAGQNTAGAVVYLNPGSDHVAISGNTFQGEALADSPLLGIEGDDVQVDANTFGPTTGEYAKVEIFKGANGTAEDIVLTGNTGLDAFDVVFG